MLTNQPETITDMIRLQCDKCGHWIDSDEKIPTNIEPTIINPDGLYRCVKCPCHVDHEVNLKGNLLNSDGSIKERWNELDRKYVPVKCPKRCRGTYRQVAYKETEKVGYNLTIVERYNNLNTLEPLKEYWLQGTVFKKTPELTVLVDNAPKFYPVAVQIHIPELRVRQFNKKTEQWEEINPHTLRNGNLSYGFNMFNALTKAFVTHSQQWIKIPAA